MTRSTPIAQLKQEKPPDSNESELVNEILQELESGNQKQVEEPQGPSTEEILLEHQQHYEQQMALQQQEYEKVLQEHVNSDVLQNAEVIDHIISSKQTSQEKFAIGEEILKKYASAKLVITSRIHAALPCLALGTPVLFVTDGLEKESIHTSRLKGTIDHLNILSTRSKKEIDGIFDNDMNVLHPEDIDWNNPPQNPNTHTALSEKLKETCKAFING